VIFPLEAESIVRSKLVTEKRIKALVAAATMLTSPLAWGAEQQPALYVAVCLPNQKGFEPLLSANRIVLIASLTPAGSAALATPTDDSTEPDLDPDDADFDLTDSRWYQIKPDSSVVGKQQPRRPQIVDKGYSASEHRYDSPKIVLGSCNLPGTLYSTGRLQPLAPKVLDPVTLDEHNDALVSRFQLETMNAQLNTQSPTITRCKGDRLASEYPFEEVRLTLRPASGNRRYGLWGLFERRKSSPEVFEWTTESPDRFASTQEAVWARWPGQGLLIGLIYLKKNEQEGSSGDRVRLIVADRSGKIQSRVAIIDKTEE
jgi:hypothetical protein